MSVYDPNQQPAWTPPAAPQGYTTVPADAQPTTGGDRWALVRHVYLPAVASWVLGNLKIAVGFAFTGACVGEFVAATHGLGYLLSFAHSTYNAALMFALILLIMVVVLLIFALAGRLERRLLRWN